MPTPVALGETRNVYCVANRVPRQAFCCLQLFVHGESLRTRLSV